jgi:hypothetical protein
MRDVYHQLSSSPCRSSWHAVLPNVGMPPLRKCTTACMQGALQGRETLQAWPAASSFLPFGCRWLARHLLAFCMARACLLACWEPSLGMRWACLGSELVERF